MASAGRRYSKDELARRGEELYATAIREQVAGEPEHKFVLIDIESGDFEVDGDELAASDRLLARHPDAQVWLRRVGSPFARRYGSRRAAKQS
jgi:hypothetical protein